VLEANYKSASNGSEQLADAVIFLLSSIPGAIFLCFLVLVKLNTALINFFIGCVHQLDLVPTLTQPSTVGT